MPYTGVLDAGSSSGQCLWAHMICLRPMVPYAGVLTLHAMWQAEATALAQPALGGADIDADFKGLDVLPLVSPAGGPLEQRGAPSSQAQQRLRLNGRTRFSVRLDDPPAAAGDPAIAGDTQRRQDETGDGGAAAEGEEQQQPQQQQQQQAKQRQQPAAFSGDLTLEGLRVNQLKLSRNLTGTLALAGDRFQLSAKARAASPHWPCCSCCSWVGMQALPVHRCFPSLAS